MSKEYAVPTIDELLPIVREHVQVKDVERKIDNASYTVPSFTLHKVPLGKIMKAQGIDFPTWCHGNKVLQVLDDCMEQIAGEACVEAVKTAKAAKAPVDHLKKLVVNGKIATGTANHYKTVIPAGMVRKSLNPEDGRREVYAICRTRIVAASSNNSWSSDPANAEIMRKALK